MPTTDVAIAARHPRLVAGGLIASSVTGAMRRWLAGHWRALLPLILIVPIPAACVLVLMAVPGIRGAWPGRLVYLAAKTWIILLPFAWLLLERGRLSLSPIRRGGLGVGLLTGLGIFCIITLAYWLFGRLWIDPEAVQAQVRSNGFGNPLFLLPFLCGLTLLNSLMEEYVWRWFVFSRCEKFLSPMPAAVLTAGLFTLHHIVALRGHVGWDVTALGSAGCFLGGLIWSWQYARYRSIWPGYVSHVLADAAICLVAWRIMF